MIQIVVKPSVATDLLLASIYFHDPDGVGKALSDGADIANTLDFDLMSYISRPAKPIDAVKTFGFLAVALKAHLCVSDPVLPIALASAHSQAGDTQALKLLIDDGADVNQVDTKGNTPLHWASMRGSLEAVLTLLSNGADPILRDRAWKRPSDVAHNDEIRCALHAEEQKLMLEASLPRPIPTAAVARRRL
jgi:hypothetical protein